MQLVFLALSVVHALMEPALAVLVARLVTSPTPELLHAQLAPPDTPMRLPNHPLAISAQLVIQGV